ncbi:RagB/SusD family nutrient uptake outer membrane protein [Marinifilum fragile]|uniref:RagB/SusD family nutrient uptake outer membrane protein n=1 Tax=Marinifilum fragile TaxID=570161 RepID=UPI002AA5E67A|nr:RagB/SusD family nutrient uptake outer membrane protein [Marinifilum fragile]
MKSKLLYILLVFSILSSCSDDYLETSPTSELSKEDLGDAIKANPAVSEATLRGMYALLNQYGSGGTSSQVDFGIKSYDISTDMVSGDMAQNGNAYNKFWEDELLNAVKRTNLQTYRAWRFHYRVILAANNLIASSGTEEAPNEGGEFTWAQAKALRAYMYYQLVGIYGKGWAHKDDKVLPLYLSTDVSSGAKEQSTNELVLTTAKNDLIMAIKALDGYVKESKTNIDANVAKGMLAYVCLATEDYENAKKYSQEVIDVIGGNLMTADEVYNSGFRSIDINGWMWGMEITTENTTKIGGFFPMLDVWTYGYASTPDRKRIDRALYAKVDPNDIRRFQFMDNPNSSFDCIPWYKFWDANRVFDGDKQWTHDYVFMRVAEMYLINAEAKAFLNDPTAKDVLEFLISKRHAAGVIGSDTGEPVTTSMDVPVYDMSDLKKAANLQWRIECWGEGKAYWVLKRFKYDSERGSNHHHKPNTTIPYDSDEITFQIPENEVLNNPFME